MTISSNTLLQVIGLLFSIVGVIWYISTILSKINAELSKSAQLNTIQEEKINSMDTGLNQQIKNNYDTCKNGRIDIWKDLNELKLKVAKLEAKEK